MIRTGIFKMRVNSLPLCHTFGFTSERQEKEANFCENIIFTSLYRTLLVEKGNENISSKQMAIFINLLKRLRPRWRLCGQYRTSNTQIVSSNPDLSKAKKAKRQLQNYPIKSGVNFWRKIPFDVKCRLWLWHGRLQHKRIQVQIQSSASCFQHSL